MRTAVFLVAALALPACKDNSPPPAAPATPKAEAPKPSTAAATSDSECIAAWAPTGAESTSKVGDFSVVRTGTKLVATSTGAPELVVGVIADVKENTPQNISNLKKIIAHFRKSAVELVVIAGDLGDTQDQIEDVLELVGRSELPAMSIIGNREPKAAYNAAYAAASQRHPNLFDLNQTRLAIFDGVAFVSMPGYYNLSYIHADTPRCHYQTTDVAATKAIVEAAGGATVVLVSHGPPKQDGAEALDRTLEQANVGDPALKSLIADTNIRFGIFANIHESGGRATDLAGTSVLPQGTATDGFFINPGPADSVRWSMNDGSESAGMAAVVRFSSGRGTYDIFRVGD